MAKTRIVGVGMTKIGRHYEKGFKELSMEAIDKAVRDAGVEVNELDYLIVSTAFPELTVHQSDIATILAQELGIRAKAIRVDAGEASGAAAVSLGSDLINSGKAKVVLAVGVEKMSEYPSAQANSAYSSILDYEYEGVHNISIVNYAAMSLKSYMSKYRVRRDDIFEWAIKMHGNASNNPYAYLAFKVTLDKVRNSQVISDPITIYDTFPICDGAAALILTNEEVSTTLKRKPVELLDYEASVAEPLYLRDELTELPATRKAFRRLLEKVKLVIDEETAIQVHDSFSIYGLLAVESLGLAEKGKAPEVIDSMPYLNHGGGLKARGHPIGATSIYGLSELTMLMQDRYPGLHYSKETGVLHSMSGQDSSAWIIVLRR